MWFKSNCAGQKLMKYKVNANLIFTLPSKLLIFIIDHAESLFFFLSLTTFSLQELTEDFQLALHKPENSMLAPKLVFPSK